MVYSVHSLSQGLCDRFYGECACFKGWSSSDGAGDHGDRGDCGHRVKGTTKLHGALGLHDNNPKATTTTTSIKDFDTLMRAFTKDSYKDMGNVALANVLEDY